MRIGYDGKRAVSNNTGLGNYSRLVIEAVAKEYPEAQLDIFTPKMKDNPRLEAIRNLPNVSFSLPEWSPLPSSLWRTFGITGELRDKGIDIYHGLSNELPLNIRKSGVPSVVTIHDLIYRRLPQCYKPIDRKLYDYKYGTSCRNADRIIAVSQRTKLDIMEYYGIPEDKIDVVYQGCDKQFKRAVTEQETAAIRKRYGLDGRYIIQVGTVELRKNSGLTVSALAGLDKEIKLIIVGRDHHGYKKEVMRTAQRLGVTGRLRWLEGVPFADLPALYAGADVAAYPSLYEGFGIPIIEAISSGTPVVAATGSCLEEAGGPGALYIDPRNADELAAALRRLLEDKELNAKMVAEGREYVRRFDNTKMAGRIMDVYRRVLNL